MKNLKFENIENTIYMTIDGQEAGFISFSGTGTNGDIQDAEIGEEFQGKGFYRMLIHAVLRLSEVDSLRSWNRNDESNAIWEHWTGEQLEPDQNCYVDMNSDGSLDFFAE